MGNDEDDLRQGVPWRTMASRSGMFFVAIILGPIALAVLIQVVFHPEILWKGEYLKWVWFVLLGGLGSLFDCVRRSFAWYYTSSEGIERRGLMGRRMLPWIEVEAVGTQKIYRKGGWVDGVIVYLYGRHRTFRPMLSEINADSLIYLVVKQSPEVLRIDENAGTFELPQQGDGDSLRSLVARHAQRLRREHGFALILCGLVLVPVLIYAGSDVVAGTSSWSDVEAVLFSLVFFLALSWQHGVALWRLRK